MQMMLANVVYFQTIDDAVEDKRCIADAVGDSANQPTEIRDVSRLVI
jgi:hypothetical protein